MPSEPLSLGSVTAGQSQEPPPLDTLEFHELTDRIASGQCTAFVGAGLSFGVCLGWDDLVVRICSACGRDIQVFQEAGLTLPQMAQKAKEADLAAYERTIREVFCYREPTFRHVLLARIPFHAYLTTNYDSLLLEARRAMPGQEPIYSEYPNLRVEARKDGEIFFLHGRVDYKRTGSPLKVVLAEEEYDFAYQDSLLHSFLEQYLPFHTICFIGCSFRDVYLQKIFLFCRRLKAQLASAGHKNDVRWYILLDNAQELSTKAADCGLTVIRYDRIDDRHEGLRQVLEYWSHVRQPTLRQLSGDEKISYENVEVPR